MLPAGGEGGIVADRDDGRILVRVVCKADAELFISGIALHIEFKKAFRLVRCKVNGHPASHDKAG